jgi:dihydrofolate synthase/folylpolyglutamate synthase
LPEEAVIAGLEHVQQRTGLAGRWQILQTKPLVVADTAHNVNGLEQVFKQAQEKAALGRLYIILGMVADKDLEKVFSLLPHYASYIFAEPSVFRARKAAELAQLIEENTGIQGAVCPDVNLAIEQLLPQLQPDDVVLITGSTFLVADLNQLV